jgi:septal ring factor EnvC (AmiA/AmiB activator)
MSEPSDPVRANELQRRRDNELKDLETEARHEERPLEGLSAAPTTWTDQQDEAARAVHERDEAEARRRSEAQVPPAPPDRTLPE